MPGPFRTRPVIVAIPVRDEADHIGACLRSLAWQREVRGQRVLLLVNNTTDGTVQVVQELRSLLPIAVEVIEHSFPPAQATAGHARSLVMQRAAEMIGPGGVLLSTDADSRPEPDWLLRNLQALGSGVDAVAGRAILDPGDAASIPSRLHEDDARECAYSDLLDAIAWHLDPEPHDPLPRHAEHSGASICVTAEAFRLVGGVPAVALGEDRAFFDALRREDQLIRHEPQAQVVVSGRIFGRAKGGMADTIRRRLLTPDPALDDRLEPVTDWARRYRLRARLRSTWAAQDMSAMRKLAGALRMPTGMVADLIKLPRFGRVWSEVEARSPALVRRPVLVEDLPREMAQAARLHRRLTRAGAMPIAGPIGGQDDLPAGIA